MMQQSEASSAALISARQNRAEPVAAVRVVGRTQDFAEGLPADGLQISEPRFVDEIIARAVFEQFSIGELILPFDVKGLRFTGEAMPVVGDVPFSSRTGFAGFSVSPNGTIACGLATSVTIATGHGSGS